MRRSSYGKNGKGKGNDTSNGSGGGGGPGKGRGQPPVPSPTVPAKRSNRRPQQVREQLGVGSQLRSGEQDPSKKRATSPFRHNMSPHPPRIAPLKLRFVIVGGSIGGLAAAFSLSRAGHFVHVIEQKEGLVKDACGIRIPPNLARILERWGLAKQLRESGTQCKRLAFRKLRSAELLGHLEYKEEVMKVLEADFWLMHHSDLLSQLYTLAISSGAVVQFATSVVAINPARPSVTLSTGEVLAPDIVIGADGYQSLCQHIIERDVVADGADPGERRDSGTVVYSLNADVSDLDREKDRELWDIVHQREWTAYAGPYVSVLTSPSRDYKEFSIQIFVPDVPGTEDTWDKVVPIDKINTKGFPATLLALMRRAKNAVETKFVVRRIEDWVHPDAKLVLLGESAHPQIPSSTHSGSLAVEDAAVLGELFSRLRSREQIRPFLYGYQELRAERCWTIQQSECANSSSVMLPDGPAQEERDRSMRDAMQMGSGGWDEAMFRHLWENIRILFAYDPSEEAEEWWQQWGLLRERAEEARIGVERALIFSDGEEEEHGHGETSKPVNGFSLGKSAPITVTTVTVESRHVH